MPEMYLRGQHRRINPGKTQRLRRAFRDDHYYISIVVFLRMYIMRSVGKYCSDAMVYRRVLSGRYCLVDGALFRYRSIGSIVQLRIQYLNNILLITLPHVRTGISVVNLILITLLHVQGNNTLQNQNILNGWSIADNTQATHT